MSTKPYPKYKSSSIEEVHEIPVSWEVYRVCDIVALVNGYPFDSEFFSHSEGVPLVRIRDLNSNSTDTYFNGPAIAGAIVTSADVLIGMDGDFNVGRWLGDGVALLNQRMCCLRGPADITRFLEYALHYSLQRINDVTYSTTVKHLSSGQVKKIRVVLPVTAAERLEVVDFLDRETTKIDALVAEQERLLALLAEKRQAVISQAVTQGLEPSVPMRDSGVEWLGRVPGHWKIAGIGYYASVENGSTPSRGDLGYWDDGDIAWIGSGEVNQYVVTEPTEYITVRAVRECSLRVLPKGAVLVGLIGQGRTRAMSALLGIAAAINQNVAAVTTRKGLMPAYLHYSLQAAYEFMRECARGGNQAALNCEILKAFRIAIPPVDEQEGIVRNLDQVHASTARLMAECKASIGLLCERRAAVISAAVTGKIDVRGLVPTREPEVPEPARQAA